MKRKSPRLREGLCGIVAGCGAGLFPMLAYEGLMRTPLDDVLNSFTWEAYEIYVNIPLYFLLCAVSVAAVIYVKRRCSFSSVFYVVSTIVFFIVSGLYTLVALFVLFSNIYYILT